MALLRRDDRVERILLEFREEFREWRHMELERRDDDRAFLREVVLRSERMHRETVSLCTEISRKTDEIARRTDEIAAQNRDVLADGRASREALFRILDRLDGESPPRAEG